jgi:hypothetical protein
MATIHGNHDTRQPYTSNGNDGNHDTLHEQPQPQPQPCIYVSCIHGNHDTLHATRATATVAVCVPTTTIYTTLSAAYMATATTRATATVYICQLHTWQRRQPQPQPQPVPCGRTPRFERVFIPQCARKYPLTTRKKMTNPHRMTGIV